MKENKGGKEDKGRRRTIEALFLVFLFQDSFPSISIFHWCLRHDFFFLHIRSKFDFYFCKHSGVRFRPKSQLIISSHQLFLHLLHIYILILNHLQNNSGKSSNRLTKCACIFSFIYRNIHNIFLFHSFVCFARHWPRTAEQVQEERFGNI